MLVTVDEDGFNVSWTYGARFDVPKEQWKTVGIDELILLWEQVVRCKDCKHYRYDDVFHRWYCSIGMTKRATSKDDFCSWGERKEDETD